MSERRFQAIYLIALMLMVLSIMYCVFNYEPSEPVIENKMVTGIVVFREDNLVWILLTSDDSINSIKAGELYEYTLADNFTDDFERGNILRFNVLGETITWHDAGIEAFEGDFAISGEHLILLNARLNQQPHSEFPWLHFTIYNLGEYRYEAARVSIDGFELPLTFGVDKDNPLEPSQYLSTGEYIAWVNSENGEVEGFIPETGEEYLIEIELKNENHKVTSFFEKVKATNNGYIVMMMGTKNLIFRSPSLLSYGLNGDGRLTLSFRNEWYLEEVQTINEVQVFLEDRMLFDRQTNIRGGVSYSVSMMVPYSINPGQVYNVTLVAKSTSGNNSTYTVPITCQYYRIN